MFPMEIWDEWPMVLVGLCCYKGAQESPSPTDQDVAASLILVFPYSGVAPGISTEQTQFLLHVHLPAQASMLPGISRYLCSTVLWTATTHTK